MTFKKYTLIAVLAVSLALSNVLAAKVAILGGYAIPAGFVGIAVAFLCTDLLSELYGKKDAQKAVNASLIGIGTALGLVYTALLMPAAPFYDATAYNTVLSQSATVVFASIITLLISQNTDVLVFHAIKERTNIKAVRNLGSTFVSQAVDTVLFISLAFYVLPQFMTGTVSPFGALVSMIVGQYLVKLVVAALDTPLFYALTRD